RGRRGQARNRNHSRGTRRGARRDRPRLFLDRRADPAAAGILLVQPPHRRRRRSRHRVGQGPVRPDRRGARLALDDVRRRGDLPLRRGRSGDRLADGAFPQLRRSVGRLGRAVRRAASRSRDGQRRRAGSQPAGGRQGGRILLGGAMVGRAIGSALLARFNAAGLLALFTAIACAMCLYVVAVGGVSAGFVALAIGLFNSFLCPMIFTLTLERSTASTEATSGLLCTAIVGGAFLPLLVGALSDRAGYVTALTAPAACYALLCLFAVSAGRAPVFARTETAAFH